MSHFQENAIFHSICFSFDKKRHLKDIPAYKKKIMSDKDFFMLLLMSVYLLEQNRQRTMQRMMSFATAYFATRTLAMQTAAVQFFSNTYREREAWVYHRQNNKFDVYYNADLNTSKDLDPEYWRNHYRMGRETFDLVCSIVNDFMKRQDTNMRETIPVPKRVGVALWWLRNGGSYRSVGQTFGISAATVGCITKDFVGALVHLRHHFIV